MKHDPLCPPDWWLPGDEEPCAYCGLIAKVRAQEETSDRNVRLMRLWWKAGVEDSHEEILKALDIFNSQVTAGRYVSAKEVALFTKSARTEQSASGHEMDPPMDWCFGDDPCVCIQVYLAQLEVVDNIRKMLVHAINERSKPRV